MALRTPSTTVFVAVSLFLHPFLFSSATHSKSTGLKSGGKRSQVAKVPYTSAASCRCRHPCPSAP
eukprot:3557718-Alexandrium_andersonii.AAC.1